MAHCTRCWGCSLFRYRLDRERRRKGLKGGWWHECIQKYNIIERVSWKAYGIEIKRLSWSQNSARESQTYNGRRRRPFAFSVPKFVPCHLVMGPYGTSAASYSHSMISICPQFALLILIPPFSSSSHPTSPLLFPPWESEIDNQKGNELFVNLAHCDNKWREFKGGVMIQSPLIIIIIIMNRQRQQRDQATSCCLRIARVRGVIYKCCCSHISEAHALLWVHSHHDTIVMI